MTAAEIAEAVGERRRAPRGALGGQTVVVHGEVAESRRHTSAIPETGLHGIPIRDELDLELGLPRG